MLRRLLAAVASALALLAGSVAPAVAADPPGFLGEADDVTPPPAPVVTPESSGEGVAVRVSQAGSTSSGRSFSGTSTVWVPPMCWYSRGMTGAEYYETWRPGGAVETGGLWSPSGRRYVDMTVHPGYEQYATVEGFWYEPMCRAGAPREYSQEYFASHPARFVTPTDQVPARHESIDPAVLAQVAEDAMELPAGQIRWSPSLSGVGATVVGVETWVWVEDAPTQVSVRAEIPGTWAQVDAVLSGLRVSAPGAGTADCPGAGAVWSAGADPDAACTVVFHRSTAGGDDVDADDATPPTVTLTATASWTASWTSSLNADPTDLAPPDPQTTTAQIAVAEVQGLVTRP